MTKAFVTGGTGFIGLNLVEALSKAGWDVTALHRPTSNLTYLKRFPVNLAEGSITNIDSLRDVIPTGTEVIFHVAGDTNMWSKLNDRQTAINVTGTENIVQVAAEKGVRCLIHTSSVAAWGIQSGHVTEETPQQGEQSWVNYHRTKWAGEQAALKAQEHGIKVVVLAPSEVMGAYDMTTWGRLFFALRDGDLPLCPSGHIAVADVQEVVKAHIAAVEQGRDGQTYIVSGYPSTQDELIGKIAAMVGKRKPPTVPTPIFRGLGQIMYHMALLQGKEPDLTPELAYSLTIPPVTYSSDLAIDELGYQLVPLNQCVQNCYNWLIREDLL